MQKRNDLFTSSAELKRKGANKIPPGIKCEAIILTPKAAESLLKRNPDNRKISIKKVDEIVNDIANDRWVFNGESIVVADTGELNDGQKRCLACVAAGKPIATVFVTGVPRVARFSTDIGQTRTVGHFLGMNGISYSNETARVANLMLHFKEHGRIGRRRSGLKSGAYSRLACLDFAYANLPEIEYSINHIHKTGAGRISSLGNVVAAHMIISSKCKDQAAVDAYFKALCEGTNVGARHPAYRARERLISEKMTGQLPTARAFEIMIRGWNSYRAGKRAKIIVRNEWPEIAK